MRFFFYKKVITRTLYLE